jgi:hypothetical protein
MNPYVNHNLSELLTIITNNSFLKETGIKELCEVAPAKIRSERDGVFLVRALRKAKYFEEATEFHNTLKLKHPASEVLKSEALWLKFSSEVCDGSNLDYENDAKYILNETSQTDPKTKLIYEITALLTLSRLIRDEEYKKAYVLTTQLNPLVLDDKGRESDDGRYFISNKQRFYIHKAKSLIGLDIVSSYINWVFKESNFTKQKREEFVDKIITSCSYTKYDGTVIILNVVLSNYLYQFDLDLTLKYSYLSKKTNTSKTILLSELSQYLFCPVSYVLNKTFNVPTHKPIDSSSKWMGNKDGFYDRYIRYQNHKNLKGCFEYQSPKHYGFTETIIKEDISFDIFEELFKATITVNNYYDRAPKTFVSDDGKLTGAPDYMLKLQNGKTVVIAEKFSATNSTGAEKVYNSDIIDLEAYLIKFTLKIDYAYFLNWNWSTYREPVENGPDINHLYVSRVNVHKIEIEEARESLINQTLNKIEILNSKRELKYTSLGFANKCLNCSVYSYCEHKNGTNKTVAFPYGSLVKVIIILLMITESQYWT